MIHQNYCMQKNILFQDTPVHYRVIGNGNPVLLLHGFGEDSTIWEHLIADLQLDYRLLVPDIPGSGLSPALPGSPTIDTLADAMASLLKAEEVDSCTVLGHSMGGYIALALVEKYPYWANGLGLLHSSAFADSEEKKEARQKSIDFIRTNGAQAFLKTSTPGLFTPEFAAAHADIVNELLQKGKKFTAEALVQYYQAMIGRPDRSEVLKQFDRPVLILAGEHDKAVPFDHSLQQSHFAPITQLQILRKSAHMGMLEETELFNKAVKDYLADLFSKK